MPGINNRVFGSDIDVRVKKKLEDIKKNDPFIYK